MVSSLLTDTSSTSENQPLASATSPFLLVKPKQLVDVTQADEADIQSKSIDEHLAKGTHLMIVISKEKNLRTHHQWDH